MLTGRAAGAVPVCGVVPIDRGGCDFVGQGSPWHRRLARREHGSLGRVQFNSGAQTPHERKLYREHRADLQSSPPRGRVIVAIGRLGGYNRPSRERQSGLERTMPSEGILGKYFEDFDTDYHAVSPRRTITEHDIAAFAGLSGDYNPLHTDEVYAASTPFGQRIAHGMLGASIATGLAARLSMIDGTALAFLGLEWKFRRPIMAGDTVRLKIDVRATRAMRSAGGGIVTFGIVMENSEGLAVQKGKWNILVKSRSFDVSDSEPPSSAD